MMNSAMSSPEEKTRSPLRVPSGRIERAARFGSLASGLAAGLVGEGIRRWTSGQETSYSDMVFSPANAERLLSGLGRMRGAAMKLGQALSLELDGVMPEGFTEVLSSLQASGHTMTAAQRNAVLGEAWGPGWRRRFEHFEEEPFAAASIGQVHRARLASGRDVAIKIQFPGVADSIEADVDNLALLFRATGLVPSNYDLSPLLDAVKDGLKQETDYEREARSLVRYAQEMQAMPDVRVPLPIEELTTDKVLAMDFLEGVPVSRLWENKVPQDHRDHIARTLLEVSLHELLTVGFVQSDPNFGNFLVRADELICLDLGAAVEVSDRTRSRVMAMMQHGVRSDIPGLIRLFREFEWVGDEPDSMVTPLAELVAMSCEPLRTVGPYDFAAADLHTRARDLSTHAVFEQGMRRPPPAEIVFLNRKLGGAYLLCARLGASVAVAELAEPYLRSAPQQAVD